MTSETNRFTAFSSPGSFAPLDFSPPRIFRPQHKNGRYEDFSTPQIFRPPPFRPPRTIRPSHLKPDTSTGGFFGPSVSNLCCMTFKKTLVHVKKIHLSDNWHWCLTREPGMESRGPGRRRGADIIFGPMGRGRGRFIFGQQNIGPGPKEDFKTKKLKLKNSIKHPQSRVHLSHITGVNHLQVKNQAAVKITHVALKSKLFTFNPPTEEWQL